MKFTSEDLMKAMGLQVGDRIKITMQFYGGLVKTGLYEITKFGSLKCLPNQDKKDYLIEFAGCKIETLINEAVDYEILPRPKRVGDLKCRDVCEDCNKCPLRIICSDYFDELNNFYKVLEQYKVSAGDLFDQEIYDLLKSRLDKVVE